MPSNYPGNLDNLSNPASGDKQSVVSHSAQHINANDAIEAIQSTLGILPQGGFATVRARLEDIEGDIAAIGSGFVASLLDGSITGAKIVDGSVTEGKLAAGIISNAKLKTDAVETVNIKNLAVTGPKIQADSIDYSKIANSSKYMATRAANQAIGGTSSAYISWDTEQADTASFVSALPNSTITVPSGQAGLYLIVASVFGFSNTNSDFAQIETNGGAIAHKAASGGGASNVFCIADVGVGQTIRLLAFNGGAGSMNATARIAVVKLFDA